MVGKQLGRSGDFGKATAGGKPSGRSVDFGKGLADDSWEAVGRVLFEGKARRQWNLGSGWSTVEEEDRDWNRNVSY